MRKKKKFLGLATLMIAILLLVGCNQELGNLTVEVTNNDGQNLDAQVQIEREGKTRNKETKNGLAQFKELPTGEYQLEVRKDKFNDVTESITITEKNLNYQVSLEEKLFDLQVMVTNQAGDKINATAELKGTETTKTTEIARGTTTIKDLAPGDYELTITKDGYQNTTENITISDRDITTDLKLTKEATTKEEKAELEVTVSDQNDNKLPAKVEVKNDEAVIAEDTAAIANFNDLKTDTYTVDITKSNYQDWSEEITLKQTKNTLAATLEGGDVAQHLIKPEMGQQTINIEQLADDQEAIIALSYLNWDDITADKIYPVRRKENKLVEERGTNFANTENNYQLGDTKQFKLPQKLDSQQQVTAKLAKTGDNINLFIAEDSKANQSDIDQLVTEFDTKIDPAITNKKNINGKITVLMTDFANYQMTGYFDAADLYPKLGNEEPMFYLNANRSGNTLLTASAHQYQHLNFFVDKAKAGRVANDAWINQGLAQLAPQLLGYFSPDKKGWSPEEGNGWVFDQDLGYLNNTSQTNLLVNDGSLPATGATALFANYLLDNYGNDLIYKLVTSSNDPRKVIADYTDKSFNKVYLNWVTTNVTDNIVEITNPIYNYSNFDLNQMPNLNTTEISTYGVNYFKVFNDQFTINPPENFNGKIGIVVIKQKSE
jgi:uncharacterized protein YkvS